MTILALRRVTATLLPVVGIGAWLATVPPPVAAATPPCAASRLTLRVEGIGSGVFIGTMHDGAFVLARNTGRATCAFSPVAELSMRGPDGATVARGTLPGERTVHPGAAEGPLDLAPGESAGTQLYWVVGSDPAIPVRVRATALVLTIDGAPVVATMPAQSLGAASTPVTFDVKRFTTALEPLEQPGPPTPDAYVGAGPAGAALEYDGRPIRRLVLREERGGGLSFSLGALRPSPGHDGGSISGSVEPSGNRATFVDAARHCRLTFAFYGSQLTLAQTGDCGFGYGIDASGRYRAVN